jgi:hypothetical protein
MDGRVINIKEGVVKISNYKAGKPHGWTNEYHSDGHIESHNYRDGLIQ